MSTARPPTRPSTVRCLLILLALPLASMLLPAPASASEATVLPYGADGWRFTIGSHGSAPFGFEQESFDDSAWAVGAAAFANPAGTGCRGGRTHWPTGSELHVRHAISLPAGVRAVRVGVAIDNAVQVFFNGLDISGGLVSASGCAQPDQIVFDVPSGAFRPGPNLVAALARDYGDPADPGAASHFDLQVIAVVSGPPDAPRDVATTPGPNAGEISLSWTQPVDDGGFPITGYRVYMGPSAGAETWTSDVAAQARSFRATGLAEGETRFLRVSAVNSAGEGARSASVSGQAPTGPAAPAGLVAQGTADGVRLTWSLPPPGAFPLTNLRLYRIVDEVAMSWAERRIDLPVSTSFLDDTCHTGLRCVYWLRAVNAIGEGPASDRASAVSVGNGVHLQGSSCLTQCNATSFSVWLAGDDDEAWDSHEPGAAARGPGVVARPGPPVQVGVWIDSDGDDQQDSEELGASGPPEVFEVTLADGRQLRAIVGPASTPGRAEQPIVVPGQAPPSPCPPEAIPCKGAVVDPIEATTPDVPGFRIDPEPQPTPAVGCGPGVPLCVPASSVDLPGAGVNGQEVPDAATPAVNVPGVCGAGLAAACTAPPPIGPVAVGTIPRVDEVRLVEETPVVLEWSLVRATVVPHLGETGSADEIETTVPVPFTPGITVTACDRESSPCPTPVAPETRVAGEARLALGEEEFVHTFG